MIWKATNLVLISLTTTIVACEKRDTQTGQGRSETNSPDSTKRPTSPAGPKQSAIISQLSIVVGDFDGDGKRDIALVGTSQDDIVEVMILAKPGTAGYPRLLFVRKRQPAAGEIPRYVYLSPQHASRLSDVLVLRTDAIKREVYEKGSVVYYLDRGVLREFDTSED